MTAAEARRRAHEETRKARLAELLAKAPPLTDYQRRKAVEILARGHARHKRVRAVPRPS